MTPQDWESPATFIAAAGAAGEVGPERSAAYGLRPLSTGEVLDRTFSIYRAHFWLFAGLASLSGSFSLILNAVQLLVHHMVLLQHGFRIAALEAQISTLVMTVLLLPVEAVVYAASVLALCEVYLGREITAKEAVQATMGRWARYVGIALWQGWSAAWLLAIVVLPGAVMLGMAGKSPAFAPVFAVVGAVLIFAGVAGGGVYGVIAYIRNSLGIPAALMEKTGVRASMRRSKTLAAGTKGRIFVVLLIAVALYMVAGAIESPMAFLIARSPLQEHVFAQAAALLIGFVAHVLVSPVALIGLTLVYFDQRVRLEAFDLVMLLGGTSAAPVNAASGEGRSGGGDAREAVGSDGQG
jgi:hypothetical protein